MRTLLVRFADADGYVTSRALDGVIRLAGLTAREAGDLRAGARVRDAEAGTAPSAMSATSSLPEGGQGPAERELPETGDFAGAVAAAMSVLQVDRLQPRPDSRLLGAEAEVGLAVLVRGGADRVAQEPEEAELCALPPGDLRIRARDCLVLHNLRLVHSLVRSYLEQGLDYADLFQAGVLGLMRAARKFDPAKGYKFSTYATWWVRQQITRAIADEGALIRIPVHMHEQMRKVAAAERALAAQGRAVSAADVAVQCDMTLQKVEEVRKLSRRTDSLDRVIGDGATLGDFVGERHALPSVEQDVVHSLLLEDVMAVLDTFSERDARVLVRRLGLDGDEPSTLDELGREFGVTRERIRQVESKAFSAFRVRLRMAGVISAHQGGNAQVAAEDGKRGRPQKRRAHGKTKPVASVDEPSSRADGGTSRADESSHRNDDEVTAAVEESESGLGTDTDDGAMEPQPPTTAVEAAEREELDEPDEADEPEPPEDPILAESAPHTADWEKALRLGARFEGGIDWLAQYALLALGQAHLTLILGPRAAADVVRAARESRMPDRQVLTALEVLQRVFDTLRKARLRPEDFFERPCEALVGLTPSAYLTRKPLVNTESRLAVRDALRELAAGLPSRRETEKPPPASDAHSGGASAVASDREPTLPEGAPDDAPLPAPGPDDKADRIETVSCRNALHDEREESHHVRGHDEMVDDAGGSAAADTGLSSEDRDDRTQPAAVHEEEQGSGDEGPLVVGLRLHEAELERLRLEHEELLTQERWARQAVQARAAAVEADTERQLDALEDALLQRMDRTLARREQFLRVEAEARIALLKQEQHAVQQGLVRQMEQAEESARATVKDADFHRRRAEEADRRLREYREGAETRIAALETRLRQVEAALAGQNQAVEAARRHAENVEQQAAQRIAQSERNAWARITELQQQLAAAQAADTARTTFLDRWRRT
ncbi:sigma-70 family RNA polymerase sigma factor [Streptomyces sp. Li-HN-5-11]|uniref:sigma-70 family RNA polymerase sigma factor n=1 Tax=Streptomyces sp. Li-HN-5-11 TaxID=3075432 RepID=UPI0028ACE44E|nr:sigma-70 family RNA polymerase sigma factor [Streptomyces sp. Li-HN-5-11]WNM29956.1 sigma-70 family RNA polymerase sigma factor [Streptomyces sp. Li-HN-5-11]